MMLKADQLGPGARSVTIRSLDRLGLAFFSAWAFFAVVVAIVRPGFLLETATAGIGGRSCGARCAKRARRDRFLRSPLAAHSYPS